MNIQPVRTAIIGCGMISDAYMATLTARFKIIELVGCCDLNARKADEAARKYGIRVMTMEEVIEDTSIELVIDLTTAQSHYQINKRLLKAGKHVYTEKVMAVSLKEAKELVETAEEKNLYLGVAPDTFLGSAIQTARYVVESGMIGEVTSCYGVLNRDINLFAGLSPFTTQAGGGIAFDVGIYYVTALLSILGPVKAVTGIMDTRNKDRNYFYTERFDESFTIGCENLMSGTLEFENGAVGSLLFDSNSIQLTPEKPALVIFGTMGVIYMNDPNLFGGEVKVILKGNDEPFVMQQSHPFSGECRGLGAAEMAWAIRQGRKHRASKEMAYHALEILEGIRLSGETKMHYQLTSSFEKIAPFSRGYAGVKEMEETVLAV